VLFRQVGHVHGSTSLHSHHPISLVLGILLFLHFKDASSLLSRKPMSLHSGVMAQTFGLLLKTSPEFLKY